MAEEANLLQGSLFGDLEDKKSDLGKRSNTQEVFKKEFNEKELIEDAVTRPRARQTPNNQDQTTRTACGPDSSNNTYQESKGPEDYSHHALVNPEQLTPMLRHYVEIKNQNPNRILLYRLGDFFECFFQDAITISRILEITLTSKEAGKEIGRVPMAGIPHHAADRYCSDLINRGLSVALCDQLETSPSKGSLIKRGITRILTPGTVIEEGMLQARKNNWLAAVIVEYKNNEILSWGLASADVSTGEFLVTESENQESLHQELTKLNPAEIIIEDCEYKDSLRYLPDKSHVQKLSSHFFNKQESESALKRHYKISTIRGLGIKDYQLATRACGALMSYLYTTKPIDFEKGDKESPKAIPLDFPKVTLPGTALLIDSQTRRNLELTSTQRDNQFQGSLLWAIDRTLTSMGGRCLRRWVEEPLINKKSIECRQAVVTKLVKGKKVRKGIRQLLRAMGDLERLAGRAGAGQAGARELIAIAEGLERLPYLSEQVKLIKDQSPIWFQNLIEIDQNLIKLSEDIREQLIENPPLSLTEGGLIFDGIDKVLDGLRNQLDDHNLWLKEQEIEEKKHSGINNLRIQYHRTFGYFLAVNKSKAKQVPEHWIRRQTLSNEERFITPALKAQEGMIFQAKARAAQREYELFCNLREIVGKQATEIRKAARAVAGLDALCSLAEIAATNNYCAPEILADDEPTNARLVNVIGCRHPVVEQLLADKRFEPNNIKLGKETDLIILTGPNASGKSCYLRQIGLIQLLAQVGSWVPASKASISIADRIFTRVGAVDDLAAGQSTFVVEMTETAYILNQATSKSLVLLDEIGRGTATFDGLSIAWAVSEFLAKNIKSRTVFATHYHELNALAKQQENIANFQVLVEETGEKLIFLHKVIPGGANRSYGIEAARLAGVPQKVLNRAKHILTDLEKEGSSHAISEKSQIPDSQSRAFSKAA